MSADKRTVTTDALETLGMIITEKEKRDAIHLAVDNVVAGHTLCPGEDIGFLEDGTVGVCEKPLGIVDPFLKKAVQKGQRFWLVVYPRQIKSLRHVWEHPEFSAAEDKPIKPSEESKERDASISFIHGVASRLGVSYDDLMYHASKYQKYEEYWIEGGRWEGEYIDPEFWDHYEKVTGMTVDKDRRSSFLSCSC